MSDEENNHFSHSDGAKLSSVNTGNASNPAPGDKDSLPSGNQVLGKEAEKYLREVANIEDVPDAADQQEMDDTITEHKGQ